MKSATFCEKKTLFFLLGIAYIKKKSYLCSQIVNEAYKRHLKSNTRARSADTNNANTRAMNAGTNKLI